MDDIWDEPATVTATVTRNEPLFLPSDDEEPPQRTKVARRKPQITRKNVTESVDDIVGDLFDDLLGGNEVNPTPDVDALLAKRAMNATKGTNQSGSDGDTAKGENNALNQANDDKDAAPKARRTIAKVDDERLLGERGFPALIKEAKKFKPKGKGHEVEDLDRLLGIYQFWAHNMFPRTQFRDTVDRVERVCRSRRMQINMGMWRDAERPKDVDQEVVDPNKSDDSDQENTNTREEATQGTAQMVPSSSPPPPTRRVINLDDEEDIWKDMDDAVAEIDMADTAKSLPQPQSVAQANPDDDDLEDWFNAGNEPPASTNRPSAPSAPDEMDVDEPNPTRYLSPPRADNWDEDLFG